MLEGPLEVMWSNPLLKEGSASKLEWREIVQYHKFREIFFLTVELFQIHTDTTKLAHLRY